MSASIEALGLNTLYGDRGFTVEARVHVDATAAKSIIERRGVGTVRHLEIDTVWLQEQQARLRVPLVKCLGTANPADMMTKHLPATE